MNEKLCAYVSYEDAPAALRWMSELGFTVARRQDGPAHEVIHSEVRLGGAVLMVASSDAPYGRLPLVGRSTGRGLYLLVDDVDGSFDRALTAGGTAVIEPEGTEWSFGTYEPGAAW